MFCKSVISEANMARRLKAEDEMKQLKNAAFPRVRCVKSPGKNGYRATKRRSKGLRRAYELMRARFGHQHWWPGETPFEVCVGAILTQNTAWTNVERAIANLKAARVLEPGKLFALPESKLAELIRPAGYFNVKARRLRSFLRVLVEEFGGDLKRLFAGETSVVRERLLAIHGIGPETADSLLLYAGGHHSFVIDAYTKRIFQRQNGVQTVGKRYAEQSKERRSQLR